MTKIKNTKKGMAKKTLSMSLVVAMLATSNVPVWAAEFSDDSDAAVATEAPAVDAQATDVDTFTDDTDTAPVVDDTEAVDAQAVEANSDNYTFTKVKAKKEAVNADWSTFKFDSNNDVTADQLFDEDSAIVDSRNGNNVATQDIQYVFRVGGDWDEGDANYINWNSSDKLADTDITISRDKLRAAAGKTLDLLFLEYDKNNKLTVVSTISFGTVQKADLQAAGLSVVAPGTITYDGTDKKAAAKPTVSGTVEKTTLNADSFDWDYKSTASDYVNAGSVIVATGKLKTPILGYKDTVSANCTIVKRALNSTDVIVKLTTPKKNFEYQNNTNTEVDKNEVKVYLKDFSKNDGNYASTISLDEYVKKVTLDTTSTGAKVLNVTFDADALKASKNFTENGNTTGITSADNVEKDTKDENKKVNVTALDLSTCEITLKNPAQASTSLAASDVSIVIKKNGKTLNLNGKVNVTLKSGEDYSKVGTFQNAITVAGNGKEVTGTKTLDLVTVKQGFTNPKFVDKNGKDTGDAYLAINPDWVYGSYARSKGLDYNDGKAVEFADMFSEKCVLGMFSPNGTDIGDQDNFRVTYENNINATNADSVAKLTVTAIAGDYKGCSQDFYFRINPSNVVLSTDKTKNTVTTAVKKEVGGVSLNESYTSADQYADAIGLAFTGTNGKDGDKKITSTPSANDYKVEYSFVKTDHSKAGENEVGDQVKVVVTLKENGNFKADATPNGLNFENGIAGKVTADAKTNGVITLYVPIVDKSIDSLDVSLKKDTFTFTGETINPEVVVKENGKTLKDVAKIEGITDGVNAGTATIKVSVKGYTGTKELKATINPAKLSDVVFEIKEANKADFVYNGKQHKPSIAQEDDPTTTKDETVAETSATADVKLGKEIISKMFDITYGKNINAGEKAGSVTLTPKALYAKNFDGTSLTANFDILRAVLTGSTTSDVLSIKDTTGKKVEIKDNYNNNLNEASVRYYDDNLEWTGDVAKFASVTVDDKELNSSTGVKFNDDDYELVYVNATDATTGNAPAYVAVIGKGNFKGEYSIVSEKVATGQQWVYIELTEDAEKEAKENPGVYTILQKDVIEEAFVTYDIIGGEFGAKNITYSNGVYAGGATVKPVVTVKDAKTGATLTEGTDYTIVVNSLYYDTVNAGTVKIPFAIKGLGKYKDQLVSMKDGKELTYSIDKKDLKDCSVSVDKNLKATVMNGNVLEEKENFNVKDNGDGTAIVSVVDGGKNYTGSVNVEIGGRKVGAPMISNVKVVGNKATVILSDEVDGASGYDYVISTDKDCITNKDYTAVNKNQAKTTTAFKYVDKGTYYAYCHAWTRDANGKKVFGEWSNGFEFSVTATTPDAPIIKSVKVSGSTIKVTYELAANATGYDVVLGTSSKKDNGELRPYNYGAHKVLNLKEGTVTATFKNVPAGTWTVGMHAFNRSSIDGKKVFSPWSNLKKATVK